MGYQESFIKFKSLEALKSELRKYEGRNKEDDLAEIVCIDRVKKDIYPFTAGEYVAVVCGERSEQRDTTRLKEGLGIGQVKEIVYIDNGHYYELSKGNLGALLDEHFEKLSPDQYDEFVFGSRKE